MSEPVRPTCMTCPYWNLISTSRVPMGFREGECRRHPPVRDPGKLEGRYTITKEGPGHEGLRRSDEDDAEYLEYLENEMSPIRFWDWCGEHPDFPAYIAARKAIPLACRSSRDE
jgi:hypothetical protein